MTTISQIDHIAIAVRNIEEVRPFYEGALGLRIDRVEEMPSRGIKTAFILIGESKIELIEPMSDDSEISKFLAKRGPGIHHIALRTSDIDKSQERIRGHQGQLVYDDAQGGANNTRVNFIHPKSSGGALLEIVAP